MIATANTDWPSMSADEFAALEAAMGATLVNAGGVWWRQVRPFFYRPLLPFREFQPDELRCPLRSHIGGVQHLVPAGAAANSRMNLLVFEEPGTYSLDGLSQGSRRHIRRAMKRFSVEPMLDVEKFIVQAHPVYLSFYERTKYAYKSERTDRHKFAAWARTVFRFPKTQVRGAYRGRELASVSISYAVEDVVFTATFFSKSDALPEFVAELMLHAIREQAAASENVNLIFAAIAGMERGLDEFYLRRGARLVSRPARLRMNPLVATLLKNFKKNEYEKLGASAGNAKA